MAKKIAEGVYELDSETRLQDGAWKSGGSYLVSGEDRLAAIEGAEPGDTAYTAGWKHMWQLDTDGTTWVTVV